MLVAAGIKGPRGGWARGRGVRMESESGEARNRVRGGDWIRESEGPGCDREPEEKGQRVEAGPSVLISAP